MRALMLILGMALLVLPVDGATQVMYVQIDSGGWQVPYMDVDVSSVFDLVVTLDTGGTESSAAEFVMTELTTIAPGVFKLATLKINNTPLDLGDNARGEYILAFGDCFAPGVQELVRVSYGAFVGPVPADTVVELRGFQPGDSQPSNFGGELGFIDCDDVKYIVAMGGTSGGATGAGVVFRDGSCILNPTPPVTGLAGPVLPIWPISEGGNGNAYILKSSVGISWTNARIAAEGQVYDGVAGHLATLSSAAEAEWVAQRLAEVGNDYWLGGLQSIDDPPDENWRWIDGEEWSFTDWAPGEPRGVAWDGFDYLLVDNRLGGGWVAAENERGGVNYYLVEFPRTAKFKVADVDLPDQARAVAWTRMDRKAEYQAYITRRSVPNQLLSIVAPDSIVADTDAILADSGDGFSTLWFEMGDHGANDAYVMNGASQGSVIFNAGHGTFYPFVAFPGVDDSHSRVAVAWDPDGDRDLDLLIGRAGSQSDRYMQFDSGTFSEATPAAFGSALTTTALALADHDNDGDLDVYVVHWGAANRLIRNEGGGVWVDVTPTPLGDAGDGSSAAWGDYDNDGFMDLALTNASGSNRIFRNLGAGQFEDATPFAMTGDVSNGNSSWIDFDNDGWIDLFYTRGPGSDRLWQNVGGELAPIVAQGLEDFGNHAGAAWADFDGDGDLDLIQAEFDAGIPSRLVENVEPLGAAWFELDLVGVQSNEYGIGARVRVVAGDKSQIRDVLRSAGNKSQNMTTLHFGLGTAESIDSLIIEWPSGLRHLGTDLEVRQRLEVWERGSFTDAPGGVPARGRSWLGSATPNPFNPSATISFGIGEPGYAQLVVYDIAGRRVRTLVSGRVSAGRTELRWDGRDERGRRVASGVYLYRLIAGEFSETKRMVLLK